jgi:putative sterol carrier protein
VIFASREWLAALVAALNRQPDLAKAIDGLGRDAAVIVERDAGFAREVAAYGRRASSAVEARLLADADDVLELEPAYVVRAPYRLWKELLRGTVDPVKAALSGRVKVEGDLEALVRRAGFAHVARGALAEVPTEFPDEEGRR